VYEDEGAGEAGEKEEDGWEKVVEDIVACVVVVDWNEEALREA